MNDTALAPVAVPAGRPNSGWVPLEEVVAVVQQAQQGQWAWSRNPDCKYLDLRIDMRDGHCQLRDRNGKTISLDMLRRQLR